MLWLALYYENTFGKALSGFFIILGIFMLTDERSELNLLRASKAGFMFLYRYEKGVNENEN